jgi:hypothetical protein
MMKKVIVLLILQLSVLMAADFTMSKSGTLTKETSDPATTTPIVTEPVVTVPVSQAGIIPNSVSQIWSDMSNRSTVFPALMPSNYGQFYQSGWEITKPIQANNTWTTLQPWFEIESQGNGGSCSGDTNTATNSRVQLGYGRAYALINGTWQQVVNTKTHGGGQYPFPNSWERNECDFAPTLSHSWTVKSTGTDGNQYWYPKYGYRFHGWSDRYAPSNPRAVQAFFYTIYMRVVKIDPNGPDDRDLSRFVAHLGTDWWISNTTLLYDVGISGYKRITKDWVAFNFISEDLTQAQLEANPPPISLEP